MLSTHTIDRCRGPPRGHVARAEGRDDYQGPPPVARIVIGSSVQSRKSNALSMRTWHFCHPPHNDYRDAHERPRLAKHDTDYVRAARAECGLRCAPDLADAGRSPKTTAPVDADARQPTAVSAKPPSTPSSNRV